MKPLSIEVACRLRTDGLNSFKLQSIVSASAFPKLQFVHPKWDRQQFRQQSTTTKDRQNNTHMNIRGMKIIIEPTFTNLFLKKNWLYQNPFDKLFNYEVSTCTSMLVFRYTFRSVPDPNLVRFSVRFWVENCAMIFNGSEGQCFMVLRNHIIMVR